MVAAARDAAAPAPDADELAAALAAFGESPAPAEEAAAPGLRP
jgi:hypothetical protein